MENKPTQFDKVVKISIIALLFLVATSMFYYFLIRPYSKDRALKKCIRNAEILHDIEDQNLENELKFMYSQRSLKEDEKQKAENEKKELVSFMDDEINNPSFKQEFERRKSKKVNEHISGLDALGYLGWGKNKDKDNMLIEKAVRSDYYKENEIYNEAENKLANLRSEINKLNEKIDGLNTGIRKKELEKSMKESKEECFKIY